MRVLVTIRRRTQIADPQGTAVEKGLRDLGYDVSGVRIDRTIALEVPDDTPDAVRASVGEMCDKLLANPVMEDYEIDLVS